MNDECMWKCEWLDKITNMIKIKKMYADEWKEKKSKRLKSSLYKAKNIDCQNVFVLYLYFFILNIKYKLTRESNTLYTLGF